MIFVTFQLECLPNDIEVWYFQTGNFVFSGKNRYESSVDTYVFCVYRMLQSGSTQTILLVGDSSHLTVKVLDVLSMKPVSDYTLIIVNEKDSIGMEISDINALFFELKTFGLHKVILKREGYPLNECWMEFPNDTMAYAEIEFFSARDSLSKSEIRLANQNTSRLPDWNPERMGGFQRISPRKGTYFTSRLRIRQVGSVSTIYGSSDDFR